MPHNDDAIGLPPVTSFRFCSLGGWLLKPLHRSAVLFVVVITLAAGCGREQTAHSGSRTPLGPPPAGALRVVFLDVGQGDAALIQTPGGKSLLMDGGPPEAGPRLVRALQDAGVRRLHWMLGSHPHADHIGGLAGVLRGDVPVERALDPGYNHGTALQRTYLQLLKQGGVNTSRARAGATLDIDDGVSLEILAPGELLIEGTDSDANNNSIVARLVFGRTRFLFTGDLEAAGRGRMLRSASRADLEADVLKVAHHGSHDGTDRALLDAVRPKYAVISCAGKNEYGYPHAETMRLLEQGKVAILRTDLQGDIVLTSDGTRVQPPSARPVAGRTGRRRPEERVIANRWSKIFHSPGCSSLPSLENRVEIRSGDDAENAGFRRHHACLGR